MEREPRVRLHAHTSTSMVTLLCLAGIVLFIGVSAGVAVIGWPGAGTPRTEESSFRLGEATDALSRSSRADQGRQVTLGGAMAPPRTASRTAMRRADVPSRRAAPPVRRPATGSAQR